MKVDKIDTDLFLFKNYLQNNVQVMLRMSVYPTARIPEFFKLSIISLDITNTEGDCDFIMENSRFPLCNFTNDNEQQQKQLLQTLKILEKILFSK